MSDKAIFLDRDETLIEDPGYINHPDQVKLLDGVAEALIELKALGYKLIIATNQSGVARGIVTEKTLGEIHNRLKQLLAERGVFLDRIYYCPYHPDGAIPEYRRESDCRKPKPGMLLKAADEMDIDLGQSWCIGNNSRDIEAGLRAGCKTILIDMPSHKKQFDPGRSSADYRAVNIKEAVNIIKKYHRCPEAAVITTKPSFTGQAEPVSQTAEQVTQEPERVYPTEQEQGQAQPIELQTASPKMQTAPPELQTAPPELQTAPPELEIAGDRTEQLLYSILKQLKSMQRDDMFGEFSIMRLMAGIIQIAVLFCLLITIWFLLSPNKQDSSVSIALGFAIVLQLMSLTFYTMQGRK
jgi:D-glycero-D-manno-heptose 1,7-bisphosphate phosphatase